MLHDLFLLSEYFEPPRNLTEKHDLERQYGVQALLTAIKGGYVQSYRVPCAGGGHKTFYGLSDEGTAMVQQAYMAAE